MDRKLTEDLHQHFEQIENQNLEERHFLRQLTEEIEHFQALSLTRNDLVQVGFDGEKVDDFDMTALAKKIGGSYTEVLYWESLKTIATDMRLPKIRYSICPKCERQIDSRSNRCNHCGETWSEDLYILVSHPYDTSYFEQEEIGYPCFNNEDNGALYISEYEFILQFGKKPDKNRYYKPVQWPESQQYLELQHENESAFELCELIECGKIFDDFGGSSIWVPLCLIEKTVSKNGK